MASAALVVSKSGISAALETGGLGKFQLIFRRAMLRACLPCRGHKPESDEADRLLIQAMVELAFFDECDDVLEWADELELDVSSPETLAEFKAVDEARSNLIALIGQQRYDGLQTEIAVGQAISAAAFDFASGSDE